MTNKEVKEWLLQIKENISGDDSECRKEAIDRAIKAIEQNRKRRWISVKERLPESDTEVLVCDNYDVFIAWYRDKRWDSYDPKFDINSPIIAWKSIPKRYLANKGVN